MKFEVTLEATVGEDGVAEEKMDASLAAVMEALVDLGVDDPFVGGSGATRRFEITVVVEADTEMDAFTQGRELIGHAIERAGASITPAPGTRPTSASFSWSSTSVRPAAVA